MVSLSTDCRWFTSIVDSAGDAIIGADPRGFIVSWNPGAERLYGYAAHDVTGKSISVLVPPDLPDEMHRLLEVIHRGERVEPFETERRCKDGARVVVSLRASPVHDATGSLIGVAFISRDVTARHRADKLLRESEAKIRAVIESWVDAVITIDDRGIIESANPAVERVFGYAPDELLGRNISILMTSPYAQEHDEHLAQYLTTGEKRTIGIGRECMGQRKDGSTFPIDLAIGEVQLRGHRMFTGVVRDIGERKRLEEQLLQSQKMETVGRLAGGVAHDFNNLMTAVIGHAALGAMALAEGDPLRQDFDEIRATADRAAALTQQLLAFARRQIVEPRVVDLNELILNMHRMLGRLIKENIELVTLPQEGLGMVLVDPNQFEQVIVNLVVNARDAMAAGGRLIIETANAVIDSDLSGQAVSLPAGNYVMLAVTDTGVGLSEEVRAHLFEPFYTTKEPGTGTGLGLATSYGIVRQAGGDIYVYSEAGAGTSMKIYLPRVDREPETPTRGTASRALGRGTETILLAEDEEGVRAVAARVLRTLGYTVVEASNGTEALAMVEAGAAFDIIIADVVMPEMGGVELLGAIERQGMRSRMLLTSGYTDEAMIRYGVIKGGVAFLQKPYSPEALAGKVREILDGR